MHEQPSNPGFRKGDHVRVSGGKVDLLIGSKGLVDEIDLVNGRVTVLIVIFGRTTPVEFDFSSIEPA